GGYAGRFLVTPAVAVNRGYATAQTDSGHGDPPGTDPVFALNSDNTLNWGLIRDFAYNGIYTQAAWSKNLVQLYYGMAHQYAYWTGCSTGGRQGHQFAQSLPKEYDGILAGAPAINWDRFIPMEMWGQVAMNTAVGAPIAPAKLVAVRNAAIAACDALDGV